MKQQTKTLLVWLGLIVAVLALANLFNHDHKVMDISYAKFMETVDKNWGDLKKSTNVTVAVHPSYVDISYELDGTTYKSTGPGAETLYHELNAKQLDYRVAPEEVDKGAPPSRASLRCGVSRCRHFPMCGAKEHTMLKELYAKAVHRQDLTAAEAESAIGELMSGTATPALTGAFLTALRMKGETVEEITGAVRAMRAHGVKVPVASGSRPLFDTAGTGGDGTHTFNISTAAAFVIAGAGRKVAKHGNRAASSKSGSADVRKAMGVSLERSAEQVGRAVEEVGIGWVLALKLNPARGQV